MLRALIVWILSSLLAKADPDFGKRLDEYKKAKAGTEAAEQVTQQQIARDQGTIAADQVEQAAVEQQETQLESDANTIAVQRKELRDAATKNPSTRPSDDDLLTGPLPGAGSKGP